MTPLLLIAALYGSALIGFLVGVFVCSLARVSDPEREQFERMAELQRGEAIRRREVTLQMGRTFMYGEDAE